MRAKIFTNLMPLPEGADSHLLIKRKINILVSSNSLGYTQFKQNGQGGR